MEKCINDKNQMPKEQKVWSTMHRIKKTQRSTTIIQSDIMGSLEEEETFMCGIDRLSENFW